MTAKRGQCSVGWFYGFKLFLVVNGLGERLGGVKLGGFFHREVDDLLGLDGVIHSTIYIAAIGKKK